jgi:hypothetical protein
VSKLLLVGRVSRRQHDLRLAPLVASCLYHLADESWTARPRVGPTTKSKGLMSLNNSMGTERHRCERQTSGDLLPWATLFTCDRCLRSSIQLRLKLSSGVLRNVGSDRMEKLGPETSMQTGCEMKLWPQHPRSRNLVSAISHTSHTYRVCSMPESRLQFPGASPDRLYRTPPPTAQTSLYRD